MITRGTIKKKCPKCHKNDQVIRIVYGEPMEEVMEMAEKGLCRLGGCCIIIYEEPGMGEGSLFWYCKRDKIEF